MRNRAGTERQWGLGRAEISYRSMGLDLAGGVGRQGPAGDMARVMAGGVCSGLVLAWAVPILS